MKEHSIFWPLVMIATGMLWLMTSMGMIPEANLWALTHIFPFLLIALGLGLILRAYWRFAGMLMSLLVIGGAVLAVIYAPQFSWDQIPNWGWNAWSFDSDLGGRVTGSGVERSEIRQVSSEFNSISIEYPADITILQDNSASITIEAEDNLLPQLSAEVKGGTLYFSNAEHNWRERVNPTKTVLVTITVKDLEQVRFSTAGKLRVEGLETETFEISLSGAGDITLTELPVEKLGINLSGAGSVQADGAANEISLRISGMGNFNGQELKCNNADVNISGAGSATIWVESDLNANISGAGSIDYYGSPSVSKNISGVGSINDKGLK